MTEEEKIMIEALVEIKKKSDMWQQAAQSTALTQAVLPWWNLGDIAASALIKVAQQSVQWICPHCSTIMRVSPSGEFACVNPLCVAIG